MRQPPKKRAWEVYTLSDPRDGTVRYVGITVTPKSRYSSHLSEAKRGKKTHRSNWIRSLLALGLAPVYATVERGFGDSRPQSESQWIALYRNTCNLTNCTDGGEGTLGCYPSPETRRKMSAAKRGRLLSPETRKRLSEIRTGKKLPSFTALHKSRLSEAKRGRSLTQKQKDVLTKMSSINKGKRRPKHVCDAVSAANRKRKQIEQTEKEA